MSTLDPIWVYCNVAEGQYLRAQAVNRLTGKSFEDRSLTLILENGAEHPAKGKVVFLDRAVDAKTGTLRVRAAFPNPEKVLRPGMFARVKVDLGVLTNTILVPERAVVKLQGKNFAWVIGADNRAAERPVKVGAQAGEQRVIQEGLTAGERIVVEGLQKVREGALVQPRTAAQMAQAAAAQAAQSPEPKTAREGESRKGKE